MKKIGLILSVVLLGVVAFVACNDEKIDSGIAGKGTVNVLLTDAPFPIDLVAETMVTIDKVEIHKLGTDTTDGSFILLSEDTMEINLLELSNGVTTMLASAELDAGKYDMIRMHVSDSKVVLTDDTEFDLKIPSGASSGLKIKIQPALEVAEGQSADVLLDFDVSKSFVAKGNWKGGKIIGFNFKPVVRGVYMGMTGRIEGMVTDTSDVALEHASVKVWLPVEGEDDSLLTSSFTDAEGKYKIIGLLSGSYLLTTELEGFVTDTVENVSVVEGDKTLVNIELTPIAEEVEGETEGGE